MEYGVGKDYGTVKEPFPVAKTKNGFVMGENRNGVAIFRGIPYGGKCDGKMRFMKPQPAEPWGDTLDCRKNGFCAPQFGGSIVESEEFGAYFSGGCKEKFGCEGETQSENCLFLNVLTPCCDLNKRPVVVYIHGGGFMSGTGTLVLGADKWIREEDIVLVGVNHRLNVFGFLYLGEFDEKYKDSGIAGMFDLILALKWVKDNIEYFGGDPDNVTIMGESGGGVKVSILLAMKEAQGLFQKAIVESGSMPVGIKSRKEGSAYAKKILDCLGVPLGHLELLENKSTQEILNAVMKSDLMQPMIFQPVADGIHLERNCRYTAPKGAERIPLLVGSSEDEMAAFIDHKILEEMNWDNMEGFVSKLQDFSLDSIYHMNNAKGMELFEKFDALNVKKDNPGHVFVKLCSQISFLGMGSYYQAYEKCTQDAAVYAYFIKKDVPHPVNPSAKYSWHTADLPLQMRIVLHPECEEMSQYMAHAWAEFARTGNPSFEKMRWEPFTRENPMVMVIDDDIHMERDPMQRERVILEKTLGIKDK